MMSKLVEKVEPKKVSKSSNYTSTPVKPTKGKSQNYQPLSDDDVDSDVVFDVIWDLWQFVGCACNCPRVVLCQIDKEKAVFVMSLVLQRQVFVHGNCSYGRRYHCQQL